MKSIIRETLMELLSIDPSTELGRDWQIKKKEANQLASKLIERLNEQPDLLKLFNTYQITFADAGYNECLCYFDMGFRHGFSLAAELYGTKGANGESYAFN